MCLRLNWKTNKRAAQRQIKKNTNNNNNNKKQTPEAPFHVRFMYKSFYIQ